MRGMRGRCAVSAAHVVEDGGGAFKADAAQHLQQHGQQPPTHAPCTSPCHSAPWSLRNQHFSRPPQLRLRLRPQLQSATGIITCHVTSVRIERVSTWRGAYLNCCLVYVIPNNGVTLRALSGTAHAHDTSAGLMNIQCRINNTTATTIAISMGTSFHCIMFLAIGTPMAPASWVKVKCQLGKGEMPVG